MIGFVTIRNERNMTQKQFAEYLRINIRTLQAYEQGRRTPTLLEAIKISKMLGVEVEYLFTEKLFKEE